MRKNKRTMSVLAICTALTLCAPIHATPSKASSIIHPEKDYILGRELTDAEIQEMKSYEPKTFPEFDQNIKVPANNKLLSEKARINSSASVSAYTPQISVPASYSSVTAGNITPVKDQNPWGTCWSFGTIASLESSMIAQGLSLNGQRCNANNTDLSERQLAYFAFNSFSDPMNNTWRDYTSVTGNNYLNIGANDVRTMFELGTWIGARKESDAEYNELIYANENNLSNYDLNRSLAYNPDVKLKDAVQVSFQNRDAIKRMIMTYGSGTLQFNWNDTFFNYSTCAYHNDDDYRTNHLVAVVGWDDNYNKANFKNQPENNGAWLIKNSWGEYWGNNGYFWLSYEDNTINQFSGNYSTFYIAQSSDTYDNNYQYDGSLSCIYNFLRSGGSAANRFVVPSNSKGEELKAVSFALNSANVEYSIQIYKGCNESNPISGTPQFSTPQKGVVDHAGFYTIPLDKTVSLKAGDAFSVVIQFTSLDGYYFVYLYTDQTVTDEYTNGSVINMNTINYGESFMKEGESENWVDVMNTDDHKTPRIKAFTVNAGNVIPTPTPTSTVTPTPQRQTYTHNFTTQGLTSNIFSITGNLNNKRGTVYYNNMTLTKYLKMETITNVSFTTPGSGKITLICDEGSNNYGIKIDGQTYTVTNGQLSIDLNAGTHTITKSNKNVVVYYMILEC